MRTIKFIIAGIVLLFASTLQAQVTVNVNLGTPPSWGPAGYTEVRYYYLPDIESYYDIQSSRFIYYNGSTWVHSAYLPVRYRSYDLYSGYKVVMTDYHGNTPYVYFKDHKTKYAKGYHGQPQKTIGNNPGHGNQGNKNNQHNVKSGGHGTNNNHGGNNGKKH